MKVLIFSISAGEGHLKTSLAMKKYIMSNNKNTEVMIIDTLSSISPFLNKIIIGGYLKTIKINPNLYRKLYYKIDYSNKLSSLASSPKIYKLLCIKFKKLIDEINPQIILSTHPIPTKILSILKIKYGFKIPIITIITDYTTHSFWFHNGIDAYIVANDVLIDTMKKRGLSSHNVYDLGIPVNPCFLEQFNKNQTLKSVNLCPNKFTFLIMGGSLGMGKIIDICTELNKINKDFQIIVVTGNNKKLYNELMKLDSSFSKKTCILGYTKEINKYMQACDILLTKPGGITITEAMLSSIPLVLFSPIPGQEEKNVKFLIEHSLAVYLEDTKCCSTIIKNLINNPSTLQEIKNNYLKYIRPNCGNDICDLIHSLYLKTTKTI